MVISCAVGLLVLSSLPLPKKSLGQCFLTDKSYAREIVAALQIEAGDTVVEIGPGRGVLTEFLVETPARVVAVEIDNRLQSVLREKFQQFPNFTLIHSDFLDFDIRRLSDAGSLKVVGNLPYHLSSGIVYRLLEHNRIARSNPDLPWFSAGVLMMQREVAERVVAPAGSRTYGKLSVFVQVEAEASLYSIVPAVAFRPTPQVDGGVVQMQFFRSPHKYPKDYPLFERVVRFTFSQRRKMMKSTLSQLSGIHPAWQSIEFDFTRRPETLTVEEWCDLCNDINYQLMRK